MPLTETLTDLMVGIPGGKIDLRDDRTQKKWTVEIAPFWIAKFAVTQDFYFRMTEKWPSTIDDLGFRLARNKTG